MLTDWICMHVFCFGFCSFDAQRMFCLLSLYVRPYLTPIRQWWRCLWWCMIWEKCPPAIRHSCGREPSQSQSNASSMDITTKSRPHWGKDEPSATSSIWGQYHGVKPVTLSPYFHSGIQGLNAQCLLSNGHRAFGLDHTFTKGTLWPRHSYSWCILN